MTSQTYKVGPGPEDLIKIIVADQEWLLTGTAGKNRVGKNYKDEKNKQKQSTIFGFSLEKKNSYRYILLRVRVNLIQ